MKKVLTLLVMVLSMTIISAQTGNAERNKIKTEIDQLNKAMEKAFNANDMAAVAAFYSDDAEITGASYVVSGRANLDKYWLSLKDRGKGWKLTVIKIDGAGDYFYELGNSDLSLLTDGKETRSVINFVLIWKRQNDGSYKIFRDYLTDIKFSKTK